MEFSIAVASRYDAYLSTRLQFNYIGSEEEIGHEKVLSSV